MAARVLAPIRVLCTIAMRLQSAGALQRRRMTMPLLKLPALDPAAVPEVRRVGYPEPFRSRMGDGKGSNPEEMLGAVKGA